MTQAHDLYRGFREAVQIVISYYLLASFENQFGEELGTSQLQ